MTQKNQPYGSFILSVLFTLFCLIFSLNYFERITVSACIEKLGIPLFRLILIISMGLFAGQVIESLKWTRHVAILAGPLFRASNLGDHCSAAFTAAVFSGTTANAMLQGFYDDRKINKMQLFLSNYINQFPAFFLHLPTTVFIVLPLTGFAGVLYFTITFVAVLFRTACFLVFARLFLKKKASEPPLVGLSEPDPYKGEKSLQHIFKIIKTKLPRRILKITVWVLPIYTLVFLLHMNGFFDYLNKALSGSVKLSIMPVEALSIVMLSFAAEFTSGFAAAGALMNAGVISVKQTVMALLLGNILAFPIRALRHQLPVYMGIYSPKIGMQLILSGQIFRVLSIILAGTLYYMVA